MFLEHFKLSVQPFGVTPDPRFLYLSGTHSEALASLLYGIQSGRGFTALIAAPGMGKTTLLFRLLGLLPRDVKTAFLFQTLCTPTEFLRALLNELEIIDEGVDVARMHAELNAYLLRESKNGHQVVVVIDEAQNLDESVLEMVRMLSNFETPAKKLMHIVLAGQPQLAEKLASERLIQLWQRISILARLAPFSAAETRGYIGHRLKVAGSASEKPLFSEKAYTMIAEHSGGIPRNINNLCFNSMSVACALQRASVDALIVQEAINDLDLKAIASPKTSSAPHQSQPSIFIRATGMNTPWRCGMRLAIGILISLVLVPIPMSRSSDRHPLQSPASISQQEQSGGSKIPPLANDPGSRHAQEQNQSDAFSVAQIVQRSTATIGSETSAASQSWASKGDAGNADAESRGSVPSLQEMRRLKHSGFVELSAGEQRPEKAQAIRKPKHVPFEPGPQGERP
jgi:type II secretory pathway predicted ATPase ExeA